MGVLGLGFGTETIGKEWAVSVVGECELGADRGRGTRGEAGEAMDKLEPSLSE